MLTLQEEISATKASSLFFRRTVLLFLNTSVVLLLLGLLAGVAGGLLYIVDSRPVDSIFSFQNIRPLHVFLVISWILLSCYGCIYYYVCQAQISRRMFLLMQMHFYFFFFDVIIISICFLSGVFGGREYLEFPPMLSIPIFISAIIYAVIYFRNFSKLKKAAQTTEHSVSVIAGHSARLPVYMYMWGTAAFFFVFTLGESYLWMLPFFRDNFVRDITVQWKALGAFIGSWNMLVYGIAFYITENISGDRSKATSNLAYFFYFLGLTNMMFNWGHHTYPVPAAYWIKNISYGVSMTELLLLAYIMRGWKKSMSEAKRNFHNMPFRLLSGADVWILLNLVLAILMSVPAINIFTHGTHITVAHAMGTTIGINTGILLAAVYFVYSSYFPSFDKSSIKTIRMGFWIMHISLFIFWLSFILSGMIKIYLTQKGITDHNAIMYQLKPVFDCFALAGIGVLAGIFMIVKPMIFGKRTASAIES